jgi:hypothetical protein
MAVCERFNGALAEAVFQAEKVKREAVKAEAKAPVLTVLGEEKSDGNLVKIAFEDLQEALYRRSI